MISSWCNFSSLSRSSIFALIASSPKPFITLENRRMMSGSTPLFATNYLLRYDYVPDVLEKRGPYRADHLNLAKRMIAENKCSSGGPVGEINMKVPTGALFIFSDLEAAQSFVKEDPYVENGIVTKHTIEEWNIVVSKE